jgi:hypothetical protein
MKSEYDISKLKHRGHPLREKVMRGEIKLIDPFDISDEEFNEKIAALTPDEREFAIDARNERHIKMRKDKN